MSAKPRGTLSWDLSELAKALHIDEATVREYFTDGRRVSFLLERRIATEVLKGKLAPSEGAGFDLIDPEGRKWEVRSISQGGIYFCPSYMVGSGRRFDESGFLAKLDEIAGYVVSDIEAFPDIPFWILPKNIIETWWREKQLGSTTKINRKKALVLLQEWKA
ncbi:MAG: hypothetical protein KA257_08780 [Opitutaceae bacterium]|nr:hypothetical protein [Opitutaceae bacterium]MBP9912709.1 hypothetical protein [Opitutaceae bacterium]